MIKDLEFIFKKIFFSESYLLKRRIKRAINKNYEKELKIIERYSDKTKDALDIGVYRGVYSYKLAENFNISCHSGIVVHGSGANNKKIIDILNYDEINYQKCWAPIQNYYVIKKSVSSKKYSVDKIFSKIIKIVKS